MQIMYHLCSKNTIPSKHKYIQPFPVKLHKNINYNNTFRAFIEERRLWFHQSKLSLFRHFLFSLKLDHTTFLDLLLVNEARKEPVSVYWKIVRSLQYILPWSVLFAKQFKECQDFRMQ